MSESITRKTFPTGFQNAYWFAVFNAFSFQIILGSPMVLYAKKLGASATVLGIIASLMPLLVIFQIPAAGYLPQVGFRRFVYGGWGIRVTFIFLMALVPLAGGFLDPSTQLALLLLLLFGFNLSRGISSCAWMPWITALVPEHARGQYLARDAALVNASSFVTFVLAALCLGGSPASWQFSGIFLFSAMAGAASLTFLKKMPDVPVPPEPKTTVMTVPWLAMLRHPPFYKLLVTAVFWSIASGGLPVFTVAYLKSEVRFSEATVLLITSISYLGGLGSLWFFGRRFDTMGSKPVLGIGLLVWLLILAAWVMIAGGLLAPALPLLLLLHALTGLFGAACQTAISRLAMVVIPAMGRNHFFALFSVGSSLALGLSPIGWGLLIDAVGSHATMAGAVSVNRYSLFYLGVWLALLAALFATRRLEEPKAASMEALLREMLLHSPRRVWIRLWPRI